MDIVDFFMKFFKEFNIQDIISMGVVMWYFTRDIKKDTARLASDVEKMNGEFHHMNTRVSQIDGDI